MKKIEMKDLGLPYEAAVQGVQSAIAHDMANGGRASEPKHLRVGVDMSKSDQFGLVMLLIDKGVFTGVEYMEYMRLAANNELAMREDEIGQRTGIKVTFR
jgi:hypothetical protein